NFSQNKKQRVTECNAEHCLRDTAQTRRLPGNGPKLDPRQHPAALAACHAAWAARWHLLVARVACRDTALGALILCLLAALRACLALAWHGAGRGTRTA
ncbi:hypothetical protein HAX54_031084, partial [Datura stramonium]|nr:hypothetical protein [Datura stramonium]